MGSNSPILHKNVSSSLNTGHYRDDVITYHCSHWYMFDIPGRRPHSLSHCMLVEGCCSIAFEPSNHHRMRRYNLASSAKLTNSHQLQHNHHMNAAILTVSLQKEKKYLRASYRDLSSGPLNGLSFIFGLNAYMQPNTVTLHLGMMNAPFK